MPKSRKSRKYAPEPGTGERAADTGWMDSAGFTSLVQEMERMRGELAALNQENDWFTTSIQQMWGSAGPQNTGAGGNIALPEGLPGEKTILVPSAKKSKPKTPAQAMPSRGVSKKGRKLQGVGPQLSSMEPHGAPPPELGTSKSRSKKKKKLPPPEIVIEMEVADTGEMESADLEERRILQEENATLMQEMAQLREAFASLHQENSWFSAEIQQIRQHQNNSQMAAVVTQPQENAASSLLAEEIARLRAEVASLHGENRRLTMELQQVKGGSAGQGQTASFEQAGIPLPNTSASAQQGSIPQTLSKTLGMASTSVQTHPQNNTDLAQVHRGRHRNRGCSGKNSKEPQASSTLSEDVTGTDCVAPLSADANNSTRTRSGRSGVMNYEQAATSTSDLNAARGLQPADQSQQGAPLNQTGSARQRSGQLHNGSAPNGVLGTGVDADARSGTNRISGPGKRPGHEAASSVDRLNTLPTASSGLFSPASPVRRLFSGDQPSVTQVQGPTV